MTTSTPNGPDPAARMRPFPYQQAGAFAVLLGVLLFIFTGDLGLTRQLAAGLLVVLVVQTLGQDVMRRLLGNRIDPAWIDLAGPIAGTLASYAAIGLYVATGHGPLLAIALVGVCVSANGMLTVMPPHSESAELGRGVVGVSVGGAAAGLGSSWGLAVLLVVVCHLVFEWRVATLHRREAQASSGDVTGAWLITAVAVFLALALGVGLCVIALVRVV